MTHTCTKPTLVNVALPYAPDVEYSLKAFLHRGFMKEGHARGSSRHVHTDLPQGTHLFLRSVIVGNVVVLWNHVPVLSPLPGQNLFSAWQDCVSLCHALFFITARSRRAVFFIKGRPCQHVSCTLVHLGKTESACAMHSSSSCLHLTALLRHSISALFPCFVDQTRHCRQVSVQPACSPCCLLQGHE